MAPVLPRFSVAQAYEKCLVVGDVISTGSMECLSTKLVLLLYVSDDCVLLLLILEMASRNRKNFVLELQMCRVSHLS
jgi:hypothetical protein